MSDFVGYAVLVVAALLLLRLGIREHKKAQRQKALEAAQDFDPPKVYGTADFTKTEDLKKRGWL